MKSRRDGRYINTTSQYLVAEKDGIRIYRNNSNAFFMYIPHEKGDFDFSVEGVEISNVRLGRCDDITLKVPAAAVEKWVLKNCPDRYEQIYKVDAGFQMLLPFTEENRQKLNRITAHDEQGRTKVQIVEEAVDKWLEEEIKRIDAQMK